MRFADRRLADGDFFPRGYGFAWHDWATRKTIVYPIPFNFLAAAIRWLYVRLSTGWRYENGKAALAAYSHGYQLGLKEGLKLGRKTGWNEAFDSLLKINAQEGEREGGDRHD